MTATVCCPAVLAAPLSEQGASELAETLAILADPSRLRLLALLISAQGGGAFVNELVGPLQRSQPTVSHHLRLLSAAGLVVGEKQGTCVRYRVVPDALAQLRALLA